MKKTPAGFYQPMLHLLVIGLAVLVVVLVHKSHQLENNLSAVSSSVAGGIEVGDRVPALPVSDLSGAKTVLRFDQEDRETVLLVFDTSCSGCTKNLTSWLDLYQQHEGDYRFVAVSLDGSRATRTYAERNELPYPVLVPADRNLFSRMYGIAGVPMTLIVNQKGRVVDVQTGRPAEGFLTASTLTADAEVGAEVGEVGMGR